MKLSELVSEYVTYKQALGMRFFTEAGILAALCREVGQDMDVDSVTDIQVQVFLAGSKPLSSYWSRKKTALGGLLRFAVARGHARTLPLPRYSPILPPPLTPYIYSQEEIKRLLDVVPRVCSSRVPLEAYVLRALILLLYGACLRHGEALRLTMKDVDLDGAVLCIRMTKFYKSRLVPLAKDMNDAMERYVRQRNQEKYDQDPDAPFFCFRDGRALSQSAVRSAFRRQRVLANIRRDGGPACQPRLHDLRHSGAVHRLIAWYRSGADLERLLPQLATYLGHIDIAATQRYLSLTPELLHEASIRFETYAMETHHE